MKYGLDRGKAITFCCLYPYLSCKEKKVRLFQTCFFAVAGLILNSDSLTLSVWVGVGGGENQFSHFSQPCIPRKLQCKSEKHTTPCLARVCLVCINFIGGVDCSHKAQILQLTTQTHKKTKMCLKDLTQSSNKCLQALRITSFRSTNALHVRRAECELAT